jgi:hypothetical protein
MDHLPFHCRSSSNILVLTEQTLCGVLQRNLSSLTYILLPFELDSKKRLGSLLALYLFSQQPFVAQMPHRAHPAANVVSLGM